MVLGKNRPIGLGRLLVFSAVAVLISLGFGLAVFADQSPQPQDSGSNQQPGGDQQGNQQSGGSQQGNQPTGTRIVTVTIENASGQPVSGASISIHTSDYSKYVYGGSDTSGIADVYDSSNTFAVGDVLNADIYPPQQNPQGLISPDSVALGAYTGTALAARTIKFGAATKTLTGKLTTSAGAPVANAQIDFSKESGSNHAQATSDAQGAYSVKLSGGHWFAHAEDVGSYVAFAQSSDITFANDTSLETKTLDFNNYVQTDAVITGTIKTPGGIALPSNMSVSIHSQELSTNAMVATTGVDSGSFSAKVPGNRTYTVQVYLQNMSGGSSNLGAPTIPPVIVQSGQTMNIGTINLVTKGAQIHVKVKNGLAGQTVSAFQVNGGGDFTSGQLVASSDGSGGEVILNVLPNQEYGVTMDAGDMGQSGSSGTAGVKQIALGGPQFVTSPATVNLEAVTTDAKISGRILDASTKTVLTSANGFVEANSDVGFIGGSVSNGVFTLSVPSGHTYTLDPVVPASGFIPQSTVKVSPAANTTVAGDIEMIKTNATIAVSYVDPAGAPINGVFAHASAFSSNGTELTGDFDNADSTKTNIAVVANQGPFYISAYVDPNAGYSVVRPDQPVSISAGQTEIVKVVLQPLDSLIEGKITDPNGNPVSGAFVKIDNGDTTATNESSLTKFFEVSSSSGKDGSYQIKVASNQTGNIRVFLPPTTLNANGWLNPKEVSGTVGSQETKTGVNLQFRKADASVSGVVTFQGQPLAQALVMGYGDDGASNQVLTDASGKYTMNLSTGTTWHLAVRKDADNATDVYQAPTILLDTLQQTTGAKLKEDFTATLSPNSLPKGASASVTTSSASSVSLNNGMNIQIPASALDTSGSNANVVIKPTSQIVSQSGATILGNAYAVTASVNGSNVTSPNSNLTLTFPYDPSKFSQNIQPSDLSVVSFDEATGALRHETGLTIDTVNHTVTVSVSHLTTFALAVAQDTTPPAEASNIAAAAVNTAGNLGVKLTWTNPTDSDFDHINIYQSTTAGTLGSKLTSTAASATSYTDSGLSNGVTYYYTLRSVDTTGNESVNTDQVKATPKTSVSSTVTILPKTGRPSAPATGWWILSGVILLSLAGISRIAYARH